VPDGDDEAGECDTVAEGDALVALATSKQERSTRQQPRLRRAHVEGVLTDATCYNGANRNAGLDDHVQSISVAHPSDGALDP
jgi:hypothetical protein